VLSRFSVRDGPKEKPKEVLDKMPGIYELKGDTLKIGFGFERSPKMDEVRKFTDEGHPAIRPKNFDGGRGFVVMFLKRDPK
jgi:hypothetical protein